MRRRRHAVDLCHPCVDPHEAQLAIQKREPDRRRLDERLHDSRRAIQRHTLGRTVSHRTTLRRAVQARSKRKPAASPDPCRRPRRGLARRHRRPRPPPRLPEDVEVAPSARRAPPSRRHEVLLPDARVAPRDESGPRYRKPPLARRLSCLATGRGRLESAGTNRYQFLAPRPLGRPKLPPGCSLSGGSTVRDPPSDRRRCR